LKLSKKTWIVTAIGVFVITLIGLGIVQFQQVREQNQLNEQLVLAQSRLGGIQPEQFSSRQMEMERQLDKAESQFEAVKAILSRPAGNITASSILFDIAKAHGVEVTKIISSGPVTEVLEGITCSIISLTARVEGDVSDIVNFVAKLNSYFVTGVVRSIEINIPEMDGDEKASADVHVAVYTHQGD
jgi:hypothetical protein